MNDKHSGFLICDDLISDSHIDKELLKNLWPEQKGKVISGTFGIFNIDDISERLRKMAFNGAYREFLKEWVEIE